LQIAWYIGSLVPRQDVENFIVLFDTKLNDRYLLFFFIQRILDKNEREKIQKITFFSRRQFYPACKGLKATYEVPYEDFFSARYTRYILKIGTFCLFFFSLEYLLFKTYFN
jgi:hypothetical protein